MKPTFLLLFVVVTASPCSIEGNRPPTLAIKNDSLDLGKVMTDSTYYLRFKLFNAGGGILSIDTATAGCGCTVAKLGNRELYPRDSTQLYLSFRTSDTGYFKKVVVIKSNTPGGFSTVRFTGRAIK